MSAVKTESPAFGAIFAEAVSELDAAEVQELANEHVVRLSLAAHHTLLAQNGGQLPRPGAHVYLTGTTPANPPASSQVDIRH